MSLYIDLQVNNDPITSVGITRISSGGTQPDSINTYRWVHYHDQGRKTEGHLEHRYGDGAIALARDVLAAIAAGGSTTTQGEQP